ncbi:hypothetical protein B0T09DRAFT_97232 [Sordaria sp. MPI-SDFR-AT-0083]|nr:hypothetical protein B0T09DRAFT_97232 [Sordaria sp. MPI-SDFR-AT-0083]
MFKRRDPTNPPFQSQQFIHWPASLRTAGEVANHCPALHCTARQRQGADGRDRGRELSVRLSPPTRPSPERFSRSLGLSVPLLCANCAVPLACSLTMEVPAPEPRNCQRSEVQKGRAQSEPSAYPRLPCSPNAEPLKLASCKSYRSLIIGH